MKTNKTLILTAMAISAISMGTVYASNVVTGANAAAFGTNNTVTANNATGLEIDRIAKIVQASTGNTSVRNIFDGFNLTLNFLRKADFMQARNPKAFVGFKNPVIFESL